MHKDYIQSIYLFLNYLLIFIDPMNEDVFLMLQVHLSLVTIDILNVEFLSILVENLFILTFMTLCLMTFSFIM